MTETVDVRTKTRRVKNHILDRFLKLSDKVDADGILTSEEKELYDNLLSIFAKNVVPRTQEITGEEGAPISIIFDPAFNGK
jgi:hypothetical protein